LRTPDSILRLVDIFDTHKEHYKSKSYNETQLRREFLDPFFKELGWDIDNTNGLADAYKDVIHEDAIKISGSTKAPDYCFRIGGARKYFLEAKRPSINIKMDLAPAYQLRRYAWSSKLPLSVLSDFEEFSVYDCRFRPKKTDKASKARTLYFTYDQYPEKWEEISNIFSREAVLKGSFDKYALDKKRKRGTSEVDSEFLSEIERWRFLLANNLAKNNSNLSVRDLNFSVQKIIDRIIFLRICEDRGTEDYGRLKKLIGKKNNYQALTKLFKAADDRYNSGLFHFSLEKNRDETHDTLTTTLQVDDRITDELLANLYFPDSPYEFSVLPASILGQVYEQFLGKTISLTKSRKVKIEEKPAVRKAGGVYYTPKYIVDHMIQNSLGKLLNGSNLASPIPVSKASEIKILDPACGSGSFLIEAYQYLIDWHRDQYTLIEGTDEIDKNKVRRHQGGNTPKIYQAPGGGFKLTTSERKRILLNNIHGTDIDAQAVEVTKLSLLLKVLEGETQQNIQRDFILEKERILPDLCNNIKCGNSIIGPDYYDQSNLPILDFEERLKINTFDWIKGFPTIMQKDGFNCIIGNPPYVDIKDHPKNETRYIFEKYSCANNRINLFATFVEKTFSLLKQEAGYVSIIVPTAVLAQSSYQKLRTSILANSQLRELTRLPNESFGSAAGEVKVDTVILTFKTPSKKTYNFDVIAYRGYERVNRIDKNSAHISGKQSVKMLTSSKDAAWSVNLTKDHIGIIKKVDKKGEPLVYFVDFCLGLTPYDKYRGHTKKQIENKVFHSNKKKTKSFRKLLKGNDVRRYSVNWNGEHWINYGPWLGAPRERRFFTEERIVVKQIIDWSSLRIWAAFSNEELYNTQNAFNLLPKKDVDIQLILGILNSKLMNFYHTKKFLDEFKMRFQKILIKDCKRFPFPDVKTLSGDDKKKCKEISKLVRKIIDLTSAITKEKNPQVRQIIQSEIQSVDERIDRLTCEIYNLSERETKLVLSTV